MSKLKPINDLLEMLHLTFVMLSDGYNGASIHFDYSNTQIGVEKFLIKRANEHTNTKSEIDTLLNKRILNTSEVRDIQKILTDCFNWSSSFVSAYNCAPKVFEDNEHYFNELVNLVKIKILEALKNQNHTTRYYELNNGGCAPNEIHTKVIHISTDTENTIIWFTNDVY